MSAVITAHPAPLVTTPPVVPGVSLVRYVAGGQPASFPTIDVAIAESDEAADRLVALQRETDPGVRAGRYDVLHSGIAASPAASVDEGGELTFINCFEVAPGNEDDAFVTWKVFNDYFVEQPGYLAHTLHRRASADAAFGLVNVVRWASVDTWAAAHDDRFRALLARPLPFVSLPTLTRPARVMDAAVS